MDIGCGNGFFTFHLAKLYQTYALDFSVFMLEKNSSLLKICGSAIDLPFKDRSFDVSFCSNLLHDLDDPAKAVTEIQRVSRRYVVLSEPNRDNPLMFMFGLLKKAERGTLSFSLSYLRQLVERAGLRTIGASRMGIILPNITPRCLLPAFKQIDGEYLLGFYNIVVSRKNIKLKNILINLPGYTCFADSYKLSFGHMMPLCFGYSASYASEVINDLTSFKILDSEASGYDFNDIEESLEHLNPDVVAITSPTMAIRYCIGLSKL